MTTCETCLMRNPYGDCSVVGHHVAPSATTCFDYIDHGRPTMTRKPCDYCNDPATLSAHYVFHVRTGDIDLPRCEYACAPHAQEFPTMAKAARDNPAIVGELRWRPIPS